MDLLDFATTYREFYLPARKLDIHLVTVPSLNYLMLDGHGNPNTTPEYSEVVQTLYNAAYTLKFMSKKRGVDFKVPPLEGLWWMPDMREFSVENKDRWDWTMMIMMPSCVSLEMFEEARTTLNNKKSLPFLGRMRLETYHEGLSIQILYTGAYADEGPTIARMHEFIAAQGYQSRGKHHEIYLGDPRRTAPEKLRTVLRQPIGRG